MQKINIWMDCDPGIDDAVAIAVAAASQDKLNICGISTVSGNQTSGLVTDNALKLAAFLGLENIPVVRGAGEPLMRKIETADYVHGENGLGNCELPKTSKTVASENGILFIRDYIMRMPENDRITLVPTGPLTNIALLLKTFPEVKGRIEKIVSMGGSSIGGNVTAAAEFNIWADPEAAKIVYQAGIPVVMCGLDVTTRCGLTREQVFALNESSSIVQRDYGQMLKFYFDAPDNRDSDLLWIHDAVTVLYLTDPWLFSGEYAEVDVDCTSDINRGMTICGIRKSVKDENASVLLLNKVDLEAFQKVLLKKLCSF